MKKIIGIFVSIISCLCFLTGCKGWYADEHEYLYKKMSEIPIEYEGYYLKNLRSSEGFFLGREMEFVFREKPFVIERLGANNEEAWKFLYEENTITIDSKFMEERSQTYDKINHLWDEKLGSVSTKKAPVVGIQIFDEKIFIMTCGLEVHMSGSVKGESPCVLYYYDIDLDKIYYCGFYGELGRKPELGYYDFDVFLIVEKIGL